VQKGEKALPEEIEEAPEVEPVNRVEENIRRFENMRRFMEITGIPTLDLPLSTIHLPLFEQPSEEAKERAWTLLQQFLSPEQKEEVDNGHITENGKLGFYRIPLHRGEARFETQDINGLRKHAYILPAKVQEELKRREAQPQDQEGDNDFSCSMCFSNTAPDAPWHDVVLTLLLHIRSGNEKELWKKAGLTVTVFGIPIEFLGPPPPRISLMQHERPQRQYFGRSIFHECEENLERVIALSRMCAPVIVFMDETESMIGRTPPPATDNTPN
jgi:hypothetical protein